MKRSLRLYVGSALNWKDVDMRILANLLISAFLFIAGAGLSQAAETAETVVEKARAECNSFDGGDLQVDPHEAVSSVDVTGDGTPEDIVDAGHFVCSSARSLFCGTGGCSVTVLVGDQPFDFLAKDWRVGQSEDGSPAFKTAVHWSMCDYNRDCWETFKWDGHSFVSEGAKVEATFAEGAYETVTWKLQDAGDTEVTIQFSDDGHVSGKAPCNRYTADARVGLPWLKIGPIAATRMMCPHDAAEVAYFKTLENVIRIELTGDLLILHTSDNTSLTYEKM